MKHRPFVWIEENRMKKSGNTRTAACLEQRLGRVMWEGECSRLLLLKYSLGTGT